jgi:hypothetical protein
LTQNIEIDSRCLARSLELLPVRRVLERLVVLSERISAHTNALAEIESHGGIGRAIGNENLNVAQIEAEMHDVEAASLPMRHPFLDRRRAVRESLATR